MEFSDYNYLFDMRPCDKAIKWLHTQYNMKSAWENCQRGDWMWWALTNSDKHHLISQKLVEDFKSDCLVRTGKQEPLNLLPETEYGLVAQYIAEYLAMGSYDFELKERLEQANWIRDHIPCPF